VSVRPGRRLAYALGLSLLSAAPSLFAAELPEPLPLAAALEQAAPHPRVALGDSSAPTRRAPLYLGCHDLAFGSGADDRRDRVGTDLLPPLEAQRLEILERFFDVLIADQGFSSSNEAMAIAYIQFDRGNIRRDLGQFSELKAAELTASYQAVRQRRAAAEAGQRLTRGLLAQALNRPDTLPRELVLPKLPPPPAALPDLRAVIGAAEAGNPALGRLKAAADAAGARLLDLELRQQALELLLRLQALAASHDSAEAESAWRDLRLEESRVLYEQEAAADLGFSMSQQTRAHLDQQRVAYCRALAWAELQALQGRPVWSDTHNGKQP
jgi:hypothetical protein